MGDFTPATSAALVTTTTMATSQSTIRDAMSFSNLLNDRAGDHGVEPPITPKRSSSPADYDLASPAKTVAPEVAEELHSSADEIAADDDQIQREFTCMNDEYTTCRTGQYTLALSRKVISDHFGRNKACTRDVTDWPLFCRKHYQRATYNKELWQIRKVKLILRQFSIIEAEYPGTLYDITLKKGEEDRLNEFSRKIGLGKSPQEAAAAVEPRAGKTFEAPIDVLRELDQYIGKGKTKREVQDVMDVILQMLQGKETEQVPSIEFLPQLRGKTATPKKSPAQARLTKPPAKSPSKGSPSKGSPFQGSPRTSSRGSVRKTTRRA